eukprot:scaffold22069_cov122-Isochrysis_galbana.AAC.13
MIPSRSTILSRVLATRQAGLQARVRARNRIKGERRRSWCRRGCRGEGGWRVVVGAGDRVAEGSTGWGRCGMIPGDASDPKVAPRAQPGRPTSRSAPK